MEGLVSILESKGPLVGKEVVRESGVNVFSAWKACNNASRVITQIVGKRYLRLDLKVEGYARLSPSIMREFLNYTVVGLDCQVEAVSSKAAELVVEIEACSTKKYELACNTVSRLLNNHPQGDKVLEKVVFIIAGDVVYNMAHGEPRPEHSTGELVRGSDLDIVVVTENVSTSTTRVLDRLIYEEKYKLLLNPAVKEELDYLVKDISAVKRQLEFNDFKDMVASKILYEGCYLYGSRVLFAKIKEMLNDYGTGEKIRLLEEKARFNRLKAEKTLLSTPGFDGDYLMTLFYTTEEKEEIF